MAKADAKTDEKRNTRNFVIEAARLLKDRHCEDVSLLDVTGLSQVCDYVLIGTGTSDRQMKSLAEELADLGKQYNNPAFRSDRDNSLTWIVILLALIVKFSPAIGALLGIG